MNRSLQLEALREHQRSKKAFDIAVIGGGATGLGVALDAAARGFSVVLLEAEEIGRASCRERVLMPV